MTWRGAVIPNLIGDPYTSGYEAHRTS